MGAGAGRSGDRTITRWLLAWDLPYWHLFPRHIPHSVKRPLEGRVWYRYLDQSPSDGEAAGTGTAPSLTARVLDDGTTQAWAWTYNAEGQVTSATDPLGRTPAYTYAANGRDLLEVRQTTGGATDLATREPHVARRADVRMGCPQPARRRHGRHPPR